MKIRLCRTDMTRMAFWRPWGRSRWSVTGRRGRTGFITKTAFVVGSHRVDEVYAYNSAGELVDLSVKVDNAATPTFHEVLGRDAGGRVTSKADTVNATTTTRTFDYDTSGLMPLESRIGHSVL